MKILFIIRSLDCGGAERQLTLLADSLAVRGHDVQIAVFYSGGMRERDLAESRVKLIPLKKRSRTDVIGVTLRLRRLIADLNPDIVHGYLTAGNLAALTARLTRGNAKAIWAVRDSNMDLSRYGAMTRSASAIAAALSRLADGVIANSAAGMNYAIASGYPGERTIHIANGIDVEKFSPDSAAGEQFRAGIGIGRSTRLIGLAGRLDPMKDHPNFLTAAAHVAPVRNDTHFVCVGSGSAEYAQSLRELASSKGLDGRITWLPSASDMRAVYSGLDVFCLSSRFGEGFPNVLGEAMACSRPCVATDVGDSAYVAGAAARIVPPNDPRGLAQAILADLDRGARPEARERIVENFSVAQMVGRTEEALANWAGVTLYRSPIAAVAN